jgi:hypothetical protein
LGRRVAHRCRRRLQIRVDEPQIGVDEPQIRVGSDEPQIGVDEPQIGGRVAVCMELEHWVALDLESPHPRAPSTLGTLGRVRAQALACMRSPRRLPLPHRSVGPSSCPRPSWPRGRWANSKRAL